MDIEVVKKLIKRYLTDFELHTLPQAEVAKRYYKNRTDVLYAPKKNTDEEPLRNADNRIPFNFHGMLVNQKASYMFTAPPIFDIGSDSANKALTSFLGDKFAKVCKDLCINASNESVSWIHLWRDFAGVLKYSVVPTEQIIPIYDDDFDMTLFGVMRCYHRIDDDGKQFRVYEFWNDRECEAYEHDVSMTVDEGLNPYNRFMYTFGTDTIQSNVMKHDIGEVPFFPFQNNNVGTNDLENIKPLIDVYCKVFSGFVNDLEDIQEVIFVLSGYGGENLKEFLSDLKEYKAIQLESDEDGPQTGVSTLTIQLPVEARKELLATTRKCIFEQGQGIDPDPQNFGNSSGVALSFLYALLELKAGLQETEFKLSFGRFIRCVCRLLGLAIKDDVIIQTWTRTSVKNDAEIADICTKSKGIISDRTIIEHHPYVEDTARELERIKEEVENESTDISSMFVKTNDEDTEDVEKEDDTDDKDGDDKDKQGSKSKEPLKE